MICPEISGSFNVEIVGLKQIQAGTTGSVTGRFMLAGEDSKTVRKCCGVLWPGTFEVSRTGGRQFNAHASVDLDPGPGYAPGASGFLTLVDIDGIAFIDNLPAAYLLTQRIGTPFRFAPRIVDLSKSFIFYPDRSVENVSAIQADLQLTLFTYGD